MVRLEIGILYVHRYALCQVVPLYVVKRRSTPKTKTERKKNLQFRIVEQITFYQKCNFDVNIQAINVHTHILQWAVEWNAHTILRQRAVKRARRAHIIGFSLRIRL